MDALTKELALKVNSLVRDYIEIQNEVFRFSFKKIFGLLKVNEKKASEKAQEILSDLEEIKASIRKLKPSSESDEGCFLITMRAYVRHMEDSILFFQGICDKLTHDKNYRKKNFKDDLKKFQLMEADYLEIGQKLNSQMKKLISR